MSLDLFKSFVRKYPSLATSVSENKTTWQKLYELYEMYGEDNSVWQKYIPSLRTPTTESSFTDLVNMIKKVDLDSVQKGVNNLQKTIGLLQDIGIGSSSSKIPAYEPRPLYRSFDD